MPYTSANNSENNLGRNSGQRAAVVYLARHATPDWTRTDIPYDIPPGPPLTPQGEAEATKLGAFLREAGVVKIYGSPFARTWRTAQLAAEVAGIEAIIAQELGELQRHEKEEVILARVRDLWQRAGEESRSIGPVALVTHGGCVLSMLTWLAVSQGEILHYRNQFDHRNPLPPAGAWRTQADATHQSWRTELAFTPNTIQPFVPELAYV